MMSKNHGTRVEIKNRYCIILCLAYHAAGCEKTTAKVGKLDIFNNSFL